MPNIIEYNRRKAVAYSDKWALSRNPAYYDFSELGGDCTNFVSQCLYAGSGVMNYSRDLGWYYINANDRAPAWTSARYLNRFLLTNKKKAVFASEAELSEIMPGDVIQLVSGGRIYHSLFVADIGSMPSEESIFVNAHTFNAYHRPLSSYSFDSAVCLHIEGVYN
ncbi:MAG: amidase domain-containing protein [Clostridia bacterium]|nr:amidase domain-containing protein [Clostridia bacterium]